MSLGTKIGGFYMRRCTTDKVSQRKVQKSIALFHSKGILHNINKLRGLLLWDRIQRKYCCNIYPGITVGENLHIIHPMGIIIGKTTTLGNNCKIYAGATVIAKVTTDDYSTGKPRHAVIGDDVVLGAGCTVVGRVTIGNDCFIGARAIVTKDVPPHSVVINVNQIRPKRLEELEEKYRNQAFDQTEKIDG